MSFLVLEKKFGIDLGSDAIRICDGEGNIMLNEAACIAIDTTNQKVLAVGDEAKEMRERVGKHIQIHYPIKKGVATNAPILTALLKVFLSKVWSSYQLLRPTVLVSTPASAYKVEQEAVTQVLHELGAGEVILVAAPLAAGIGTGVPIAQASGACVLHMGKGLVEAVVISLASLLFTRRSIYAGEYMDEKIRQTIKKACSLKIGTETSEEIKKSFLSLHKLERKTIISGKDSVSNTPVEKELDNDLLLDSAKRIADYYVQLIKELLREAPPELAADIVDRGVLLTGAFSQLDGLKDYLSDELNIAFLTVEDPDLVVIKGIATILDHLDLFKESVGYQ